MNKVLEKIHEYGIIPVIKLEDADKAVPLAKAIREAGLGVMEITFRTKCAPEAIRKVKKEFPEMITGAGTVINAEMAAQAKEAGADFLVAPGFNESTVNFALNCGLPVVPGVSTASEIEAALMKGLTTLKFFPAEVTGGVKWLKAMKGPFPDLKFVPTGGISSENLESYIKEKNVTAAGGSWMVKSEWIENGCWKEITESCRKALATVKSARS